jgi:hypothetical protein
MESKTDILSPAIDDDFPDRLPHTLVLFKDAIWIFYKIVFENTPQKFTLFINVQKIFSIQPPIGGIRHAVDIWWNDRQVVLDDNCEQCIQQHHREERHHLGELQDPLVKKILPFLHDKNNTHTEIIK